MIEHMYDLGIEILDGGTVRIEQEAGSLEGAVVIDLHPAQVRLIAERAGLLAPAPAVAWPRGFEGRLERLQSDLSYLASDIWLDEITERIGDGLAYRIGLTAALDRLNDLLLDAGILPDVEAVADLSAPDADILRTYCESSAPNPSNEKSPSISVTASETPKRGRPATGEAMSNAERQRAHRARQAGAAETLPLGLEVSP